MPDPLQSGVEVVRGRLDPSTAEELLDFWAQRVALRGEDAKRRLPQVVCVLRDEGSISGSCSVHPATVALIGNRRFWIYRSLLDPALADRAPELLRATFDTLNDEFDRAPGSPIGLCVLIAEPEERRRRPGAEWSEPRMIYAGYLQDGRQVRIAYFDEAEITVEESYA